MKRLMSAALVAALGVTCLGGCQAGSTGGDTAVNGKGVKIYVSLSQADAFRNTLIDAAKKTAEASGAEIVVYDAENSIENQVAQIKQAVAEDYDAIMCGPVAGTGSAGGRYSDCILQQLSGCIGAGTGQIHLCRIG